MAKIEVYTKGYCPYCKMAKATLRKLGLDFEEIEISNSPALTQEMRERSARRTVPQVFINGHHLGGNDDLQHSLRSGEFNALLKREPAVA